MHKGNSYLLVAGRFKKMALWAEDRTFYVSTSTFQPL